MICRRGFLLGVCFVAILACTSGCRSDTEKKPQAPVGNATEAYWHQFLEVYEPFEKRLHASQAQKDFHFGYARGLCQETAEKLRKLDTSAVDPVVKDCAEKIIRKLDGMDTKTVDPLLINLWRADELLANVEIANLVGKAKLHMSSGNAKDAPRQEDATSQPGKGSETGGQAAPSSDHARLQGKWKVLSDQIGGVVTNYEHKDLSYTFMGNKVAIKDLDGTITFDFRMCPERNPKEFEVILLSAVRRHIYKFDADRLTIAFGPVAEPPPPEFNNRPGDRSVIVILRRVQP